MLGVVGWGVAARSGDVMVAGITLGEVGYRAFLLVYGVVFPGYALICMLPTLRQRGGGHVSLRARHIVFGVACIAAYPMSVAGLILGHYEWLLGLYGARGVGGGPVPAGPARREIGRRRPDRLSRPAATGCRQLIHTRCDSFRELRDAAGPAVQSPDAF